MNTFKDKGIGISDVKILKEELLKFNIKTIEIHGCVCNHIENIVNLEFDRDADFIIIKINNNNNNTLYISVEEIIDVLDLGSFIQITFRNGNFIIFR